MNYENKGLIQVLIYSDSTALPRGLLVGVKSIWPEIRAPRNLDFILIACTFHATSATDTILLATVTGNTSDPA